MTDQQLLRDYAANRTETAFAELVRRHIDLIYSVALRLLRDAHLAEDVTQSVFSALAQNAGQLTDRPVLAGWLHRTTQNLAANVVRTEVRRRVREQESVAMNELLEPDAIWENIAPQLDAALGELGEADRDALLLRYFQRQSARDMARTLGVSEDAAQKRVNRAVDRLRENFAQRGFGVGAGGLGIVLTANAVHAAPIGLAATISSAAVIAGAAMQTSTAIAATKIIVMTTLQKTLITAALVTTVGAGIFEAHQSSRLRDEVKSLRQQQTPLTEQIAQLMRENESLSNRLADAGGTKKLLAEQFNELLKLRGEIGVLRQQLESQKAQATSLTEAKTPHLAPSTYLSKNQLTNAGYDTPEAALQTFMHGMLSGNYDQTMNSLSSTTRLDGVNAPKDRADFENGSRVAAASFQGQQILAKKIISDDRVDLEVLVFFDGHTPDTSIQHMVKEGNQWKFSGSAGVTQNWGENGQVQTYAPSTGQ